MYDPRAAEESMATVAVTWDAEALRLLTVMPADGLKITEETAARFDPVNVRVKVLPGGCELGDKPVSDPTPETTKNNIELEVPL